MCRSFVKFCDILYIASRTAEARATHRAIFFSGSRPPQMLTKTNKKTEVLYNFTDGLGKSHTALFRAVVPASDADKLVVGQLARRTSYRARVIYDFFIVFFGLVFLCV